ncbi:MAG: hypothetical protein ACRDO7_13570, partial [Nocardioidaceae bacterium]
ILSDWVSPEVRQQAETVLSEPPLKDSGITIEQLLEAIRIMMMAGAAVSVAVIILAVYTARRHRGARIALTVMSVGAGIVLLPSGFTGVLPAMMAIASAVLLWSRDANAWFNPEKAARAAAARADAERISVPQAPDGAVAQPQDTPPDPEPITGPRAADVPFGSGRPSGPPPQRGHAPPPHAAPGARKGMPATVLAAILTASIMSGIVVMVSAIILAGYATSPTDLGHELLSYPALEDNPQMESLGWSAADLGRAVIYTTVALLVLSLAAIGAALWLLRRSNVARIVLVVLSGLTIALAAVATLAGIPWLAAAIAVIVLLFRPSANAYFRPARSDPGARR